MSEIVEDLLEEADLQRSSGNVEDAIKIYKKILEIDPMNGEALQYLGFIFFNMGRYSEMIEFYHSLLALQPKNVLAMYFLGMAHANLGHLRSAEEYFKDIDKLNIEAFKFTTSFGRGFIEFQKEQWKKAISLFKNALSEVPADFDDDHFRGDIPHRIGCCYAILKKWKQAEHYLKMAIKNGHKDETISHRTLIGVYFDSQQHDKVPDLLMDGLDRNDSDVELLTLAAGLYCVGGNYKGAAPMYERILEVEPLNQNARKRLYLIETDQIEEYLEERRQD